MPIRLSFKMFVILVLLGFSALMQFTTNFNTQVSVNEFNEIIPPASGNQCAGWKCSDYGDEACSDTPGSLCRINCGYPCNADSDCALAAASRPYNPITVKCVVAPGETTKTCQNIQCINQNPPGRTIPGANCSCSAAKVCGEPCGDRTGLCGDGRSSCGHLTTAAQCSISPYYGNDNYQYCLPSNNNNAYNGYKVARCTSIPENYLQNPTGESGSPPLTNEDVLKACMPPADQELPLKPYFITYGGDVSARRDSEVYVNTVLNIYSSPNAMADIIKGTGYNVTKENRRLTTIRDNLKTTIALGSTNIFMIDGLRPANRMSYKRALVGFDDTSVLKYTKPFQTNTGGRNRVYANSFYKYYKDILKLRGEAEGIYRTQSLNTNKIGPQTPPARPGVTQDMRTSFGLGASTEDQLIVDLQNNTGDNNFTISLDGSVNPQSGFVYGKPEITDLYNNDDWDTFRTNYPGVAPHKYIVCDKKTIFLVPGNLTISAPIINKDANSSCIFIVEGHLSIKMPDYYLPTKMGCDVPIRTRAGIRSVTIHEYSAKETIVNFLINSSRLNKVAGTLTTANADFNTVGLTAPFGNEAYDIYISNADGTANTNGAYITVEMNSNRNQTNFLSGNNIDAVSLDFNDNTKSYVDRIASYTRGSLLSPNFYEYRDYAKGAPDQKITYMGDPTSRITLAFCETKGLDSDYRPVEALLMANSYSITGKNEHGPILINGGLITADSASTQLGSEFDNFNRENKLDLVTTQKDKPQLLYVFDPRHILFWDKELQGDINSATIKEERYLKITGNSGGENTTPLPAVR